MRNINQQRVLEEKKIERKKGRKGRREEERDIVKAQDRDTQRKIRPLCLDT